MMKIVAGVALATFVVFPAFAQSYDPSLGSGNLNANGLLGSYAPSFCEVRRMQFSDAFGWGVRRVRVCCVSGQCTQQVVD